MKTIKLKSQLNFDDRKPTISKYQPPKDKAFPIVSILNQDANVEILTREIRSGFVPKWYCVLHFNDGGTSKKQQQRRINSDDVEQDLTVIKETLYNELYNKNWNRKTNRSKSIWGIEYGDNPYKPHINLIIESLPYPYDDFRSVYVLLDRFLSAKCKCLSPYKGITHIQPVYDPSGNFTYITKESDFRNTTLIHNLNDYSHDQLSLTL
ncbi:MAG: hypothetical protein CMP45_05475 [Rickettsiales bacterium]|nr:hypothetical protein [Rickettsiales bacterium]